MGRPLPPQFNLGAGPATTVRLEGIEVTQVIQDLANSVPLVAKKATLVRVYLSLPAGPQATLRGELSATSNGGAMQIVASLNSVNVQPLPVGGLLALREDLTASLNFRLPASVLGEGSLSIALAGLTPINGGQATLAPARTVVVNLHATPPLRVKLIGLRYTDASGLLRIPTQRDFQLTVSWLGRAYPTAEVQATELIVDIPNPWPFDCMAANLFLAGLRRQDISAGADPRVHYFGLVADGGGFMRGCASDVPDHPAPDTVASGPAGSGSWGWDNDGSYADWYAGHELGHTFGRAHPGFCDGNSADDPRFPNPNGQISGNDGAFVGFDVGEPALGVPMVVAPGRVWHDVMTYCDRQWLCAYTLDGIRTRLSQEDQQFAPVTAVPQGPVPTNIAAVMPLTSERLVHVLASVDLDTGEIEIQSVHPVERGIASRPFAGSDAVVVMLDTNGKPLSSIPIRIKKSTCCEAKVQQGMLDALVAAPAGTQELRILWRGALAAHWRVELGVASLALEGASSGPRETYIIQIRREPKSPWETVATQMRSFAYDPDPLLFPGLERLTFRALATDGFSSRVLREETKFLKPK